ncbi:MAG: alkaline phosphatase PhoX [Haloechinothrix sp.]
MSGRTISRRTFVIGAALGTGTVALGGTLWREAFTTQEPPSTESARGPSVVPAPTGKSPYGPLWPADASGVMLPQGFTSRVVARSGHRVAGTSYTWHDAPDGGACFGDGTGWIYVSNSEVESTGGVGALRFAADGRVRDAYRILYGTNRNCAGGATPWGTWLSCEEVSAGYVFETDPYGVQAAARRPAMGRFTHEAAAVDPERTCIYLTEDEPDGCFYRFTPTRWPELSAGRVDALVAEQDATNCPVSWRTVSDPSGATGPTREQVGGAKRFAGGEGCHYSDGICWFTTKDDNRVWRYDASAQTIALAYDAALASGPAPLTGVDNITGTASGDLFVAEDGGNMEIGVIPPDGVVAPFLRVVGHSSSEITGPAFSPDGSRLYFSSQRGSGGSSSGGITYEVRGPFRPVAG